MPVCVLSTEGESAFWNEQSAREAAGGKGLVLLFVMLQAVWWAQLLAVLARLAYGGQVCVGALFELGPRCALGYQIAEWLVSAVRLMQASLSGLEV